MAVPRWLPAARLPRTSQNTAKHPWMMPPTRSTRRRHALRAASTSVLVSVGIDGRSRHRTVAVPGDRFPKDHLHRRRVEPEGRLRGGGIDYEGGVELVADLGDLTDIGHDDTEHLQGER